LKPPIGGKMIKMIKIIMGSKNDHLECLGQGRNVIQEDHKMINLPTHDNLDHLDHLAVWRWFHGHPVITLPVK
jgi:hypothetical protein